MEAFYADVRFEDDYDNPVRYELDDMFGMSDFNDLFRLKADEIEHITLVIDDATVYAKRLISGGVGCEYKGMRQRYDSFIAWHEGIFRDKLERCV